MHVTKSTLLKCDIALPNPQTILTTSLYGLFVHSHYEKLHPSKPHYPIIKIQKTTHIQLLCNYPLGITTSVQLSP
jgi:hypothetical protein